MKTKKPKAWRGIAYESLFGDEIVSHIGGAVIAEPNCTVYPDGAPIPQPASVRRVMRAALALRNMWGKKYCVGLMPDEVQELVKAIDKNQAAEARRKGGGK